jgi:hypothetical protein
MAGAIFDAGAQKAIRTLSLDAVVERCVEHRRLRCRVGRDRHSHLGTDAQGAAYADERVLADFHGTANAPLFGAQTIYLGSGVVGGTMISIENLARNTADAAIQLLNGEPPGRIRVPPQTPGQPTFDWRELQR